MSDVKVFGHKFSKGQAVAIGLGGLVVVYYAYKQHAASSSATSATSAIDPLTGLPTSEDNQVDPLTQMTYLAEAQQYGSVAAAEAAVSSGASAGYSSSYGAGYGSYGPAGTSSGASLVPANVVQGATYASNSAWAQAVEAGLTDIGYSSTDVSAALGRYLANLSESPAQASIVQAGIAEYGPPPVGSYQVIMASTTPTTGAGGSGGGSTGGGGGSTGTPHTAPDPVSAGPSGLSLHVSWPPVGGADRYETDVTKTDGTAIHDGVTSSTSISVGEVGTVAKTGYVKVRAGNAAGWGPWSASKPFTF